VPVRRSGGGVREPVTAGAIDLGMAGWIFIFLLFILERWLSGRE
jgi:hypothetical protein